MLYRDAVRLRMQEEWQRCSRAMHVLGLTGDERDAFVRVLSLIMHLGNIMAPPPPPPPPSPLARSFPPKTGYGVRGGCLSAIRPRSSLCGLQLRNDANEHAEVVNHEAVGSAARLLGVADEKLGDMLCKRLIVTSSPPTFLLALRLSSRSQPTLAFS